MRCLAVGGATATRRQIADVLAGRGHLVAEAPSPEAPGGAGPFDLVVFDASEPGPPEGPELGCRALRATPACARSFLLALLPAGADAAPAHRAPGANAGATIAERALDAGADDYLGGPFDARALGARLRVAERRASEALRDALGEPVPYRSVLDAMSEGVLLQTAEGVIHACNRRAEEIAGATAAQMMGTTSLDPRWRTLKEDGTPFALEERPGYLTLRTGEPRSGVVMQVHKADGSVAWLSVDCRPVFRPGEARPVAVVSTLRDVTERRKLEGRLRLAERMASVGRLAAGVAHELNNPLTYVIANLSHLAEELAALARPPGGGAGAPALDDLERAAREALAGAERARRVVRDLRALARDDDDARERVELGPILEAAANMARHEARHRARLRLELGPTPAVCAPPSRLGQVFLNLVVNAAEATPEGAPEDHEIVICSYAGDDGRALVEVRDTGAGMSDQVLANLFAPFFTTKRAGTGLGLSICHGIVSSLGGEISVESAQGKGSTFRVALPPAPALAPLAPPSPLTALAPLAPPASAARFPSPPRAAARVGHVLIIDDEPLIGASVRRLLGNEHDVTLESGARGALERLERGERFDLILCDLMMPDMTGMDFYEALRATRPAELERVIFMTGGAVTERARDFLATLAGRAVDKPIDPKALRGLVRRHVDSFAPRGDAS